ncbi:armadillo-type protein [Pilaira anomala]|nr:armadillo-type protein [Pilaira anomala]
MLLIKDTIKNSSYNTGKLGADLLSVTEEEKELAAEAGRLIHQRLLTTDFVNVCAETLVSQYMLLTPQDFNKWEEDPEGWAISLGSENWEFELRPCAEMTFMNLLSQYRDQLVPIMLNLVERVATVTDRQSLLFKDAVYGAIGLGVNSLYGRLDFEPFVMTRLVQELQNKDPNFKILRRRIGWMLGKWVTEGISSDCRKVIYEILLELMSEEEDLVVRLTAAHGLKQAVDDWDFDIEIVLPYLGRAMSLLLKLLQQVEESDTTMQLISYLNAIMDRTNINMIPYAAQIIQLLTPLWGPDTEPLLKSSLVVTFTKITSILNDQSVQLHDILIPIVRYCTDCNNEAHVYLLEDALDLWWSLLQSAPNSSAELMSLLPSAFALLDHDTENLRKVLKIMDSYILLDPVHTLQPANTAILFEKLAAKILYCREQAASYITHTIDLALQSVAFQVYADSLVQSGLLSNILSVLVQNTIYGYAIVNYMNLFARLSIYDSSFVIHVIQLTGQQQQMTGDFLGDILDKWLDKFDNASQTRARKLACIGYTNLILTGNTTVLNRLPNLMAIWSDIGPEMKEGDGSDEVDVEGDIYEIEDSAEKKRKSELSHRDPVYTIDLIQLIRQALNEPFIYVLLNQIDPTILDQVNQLLQ